MYEVYYNKQAPNGLAESPSSDVGFTSNPQIEQGLTIKQGIGIAAVASKVVPATNTVFNTYIGATGNSRLQRNIGRVQEGLGYGAIALTAGPLAAFGALAVSFVVDVVQNAIETHKADVAQNYEVQKRGVALNNFVNRGGYYD